ncbi:MAG: recombinase RecJ, partial [Halobacteria archaeon]|nr:recombinase RecJ [Halobacteria archaeon]
MEESLIEDEYLSIEERSLLPKAEFFVPNSIREIEKEREFEERISGHEHVMLADGDADGLACVVLGKKAFGDLSYAYTSPNELSEALERLVDDVEEGGTVFVVDLALDSLDEDDAIYPTLEELAEKA